MNRRPWLAIAWLGLLVALAVSIPFKVKKSGGFETNALALLPESGHNARVDEAVKQVAGAATRKLIFLFGSPSFEQSAAAADAAATELEGAQNLLSLVSKIDPERAAQVIDFYRPYRMGLLNEMQRESLKKGGTELYEVALSGLYQPVGPPRLLTLEEDPIGLGSAWLLDAAGRGGFGVQAGRLTLEKNGIVFVALLGELKDEATSFASQATLRPILDNAAKAARRQGASEVIRGGFIFHAAEAQARASLEVSTIGFGSLLGVILLMMLPFRSPKPMLLVLLPIAVGSLVGLGTSVWVFEKVHLLTLVFGSSIVGVAEDYGVHFVCGALEKKRWDPWRHLKNIRRGLFLALLTTLLGYAVMGAMPFPGLRQMGLFAVSGITAGWVTAVLWLPWLSKTMPRPRKNRFLNALLSMERHWPRLKNKALLTGLAFLLLLSLLGISRARVSDDVRKLYESSPVLASEETRLKEMMQMPSGGQFFLINGLSDEDMLSREELLKERLKEAKNKGWISGWQAVSDYVPSKGRQIENAALQEKVIFSAGGLSSKLFGVLDEPELAQRAARLAKKAPLLEFRTWLNSPVSAPYRHLTMSGSTSALILTGVSTENLKKVAELAFGLDGVKFVDHVGSINFMLRLFRIAMTWLVFGGFFLVAGLLFWMDRKTWWRVVIPPVLASLFALGLPQLFGRSISLFDILALVLVLGMGIDYGIFMNEPRESSFKAAFLSVTLGAISTLLSFGLLGLSGTPVLANFGTTVLLGIGISWLLTPVFSESRRETFYGR